MKRATKIAWTLPFLLLFGCSAGGRYPSTTLAGKVTIDGAPVENGAINFFPQDEGPAQAVGGQIKDGTYMVERVPLGKVLVTFIANKKTGKMVKDYDQERPELVDAVPEQYKKGIAIEVKKDQKEQNFDLQKAK